MPSFMFPLQSVINSLIILSDIWDLYWTRHFKCICLLTGLYLTALTTAITFWKAAFTVFSIFPFLIFSLFFRVPVAGIFSLCISWIQALLLFYEDDDDFITVMLSPALSASHSEVNPGLFCLILLLSSVSLITSAPSYLCGCILSAQILQLV